MNLSVLVDHIVQAAATVVGVLLPLVPILAPVFLAFLRDKRHLFAFAAVSRAGMLAANEAAKAMREVYAQATDVASPGGRDVTPAEVDKMIKAGALAGAAYLKTSGLWKKVLDVYGGEEAVKLALEQIVRSKSKEVVDALGKAVADKVAAKNVQ